MHPSLLREHARVMKIIPPPIGDQQVTREPSLKPCPFCGSAAPFVFVRKQDKADFFNVFCDECKCETFGSFDRVEAIAQWNERNGRNPIQPQH